jgi:hypothetical protein
MPSLSKWRRQLKRTPNSNRPVITSCMNDKLIVRRRYARRSLSRASSGKTWCGRKPKDRHHVNLVFAIRSPRGD